MSNVAPVTALALAFAFAAFVPVKAQGVDGPQAISGPSLFSITLIDINPDHADAGAALLRRYGGMLRSTPGCERTDLVRQPPPAANHFALVTVWRSAADRDRHLAGEAEHVFRAALQPIAASPVDDRTYSEVKP